MVFAWCAAVPSKVCSAFSACSPINYIVWLVTFSVRLAKRGVPSLSTRNGNSLLLRYVLHWYSDQKSWVNSWVHYFRLISLSVMTTKSSSRCYWYQFKFPVLLSCVWYLVFEKNWVKSCGWFPKRHVSKNGCKRVHTGLSFTKMFWVWPRRPTTKKMSLLLYNIYVH